MPDDKITTWMAGKFTFVCACTHVVFAVASQDGSKLNLEIDGEISIRCPKCDKQTTMLGSTGQSGELKITV